MWEQYLETFDATITVSNYVTKDNEDVQRKFMTEDNRGGEEGTPRKK